MKTYLKLNADTLVLEEKKSQDIIDYKTLYNEIENIITCTSFGVFSDNNVDIWVDDEGLLNDSKISFYIVNQNGEVQGVLAGNIVFTSRDECGNTLPLTEEQIEIVQANIQLGFNKNGEEIAYYVIKDI